MTAAITRWESSGELIDNSTARAIAQLYHSPNSPAVTALSHGLDFDAETLSGEIAADISGQPDDDSDTLGRPALRALRAWLVHYADTTSRS
ncbi:hypothetical protein [Gordonia sihwensis]|uniref:hypothetical protein n=1 Tax=Gordonia sihwensis TaxID=173559 RepID=UPI003D97F3B5